MNYLSSSSKLRTSCVKAMKQTPEKEPRHRLRDDSSGMAALRPCILVVDDDPSVAGMLHDALDAWGYNIVLASNGREGLHVLAKQTIDGILLDMHMPVMDGETMLDEIRWLGYQTPVVVMSGGVDEPTLRQLTKEGAQAFAIKPFSLRSLQNVCATVFDSPAVAVHSEAPLSVA